MNQIITTAIILRRIDYGEADRILTLLTPDRGKLRVMAKGVRRPKSKLAGGIELFSVSKISYIKGRGEIGTLVSAQLNKHYGTIVKDINRTMLGYDLIKQIDRATEDEPEPEYFSLLESVFTALNEPATSTDIIRIWFGMQLLRLSGHSPNLHTDLEGNKLAADKIYDFDAEAMTFFQRNDGRYTPDHIKFLRLGFSTDSAQILAKVSGAQELMQLLLNMVHTMVQTYVRV